MGTQIEFENPVVALSFDKKMNVGVVGTMAGSVRFINWAEETNVKIVSSYRGSIQSISYVSGNE